MFRAPLGRHGAKRFTVSRQETRDLTGRMGTMPPRSVNLHLPVRELWNILPRRRFLLALLPQVCARGASRRVGGPWLQGPARHLGVATLWHGLACMRRRSVLHHADVASSWRPHGAPQGRRACRVQAALRRFGDKRARARVAPAPNLVALPCATGGPGRWLPCGGPGRAARAPRGTASGSAQEPQRLARPRLASQAQPLAAAPLQALGLMARSGDQACLRRGNAPRVEPGRQSRRMRRAAPAAQEAGLHPWRVPAARGSARSVGAGCEPVRHLASLGWGQRAGAPRGALRRSTGPRLPQQEVAVSAHGWGAHAPPGGAFLAAHLLGPSAEGVEAFAQPERAAGVGLWQTAREWLARPGTEGSGKGPEGSLLRITHGAGGSDRTAVSLSMVQSMIFHPQAHESFSDCLYHT